MPLAFGRAAAHGLLMRRRVIQLSALAIVAAIALTARVDPVLIFNASPSVPTGFYLRTDAPPAPGAFVTVRAAAVAPAYARARGFSDASDHFIKRVAAGGGEIVCADGDTVSLRAHVVTRASHDSEGRALPRWTGCRTLTADEVFLIGDTPDSFDSRYWGPVGLSKIDGVWTPVLARTDDELRTP